MSTPRAQAVDLRVLADAAEDGRRASGRAAVASGASAASIWLTSSRVGARISARGRAGLAAAAGARRAGRRSGQQEGEGLAGAGAAAAEHVAAGEGVGQRRGLDRERASVMPLAASTSTSGAGTPRAAKVVSVGQHGGVGPDGDDDRRRDDAAAAWRGPGALGGLVAGGGGRRDRGRRGSGGDGCPRSRWTVVVESRVKSSVLNARVAVVHLGERERGAPARGRAGSHRRRDVGQPGAPRWRSLSPTSIPAAPDERGRRRYPHSTRRRGRVCPLRGVTRHIG